MWEEPTATATFDPLGELGDLSSASQRPAAPQVNLLQASAQAVPAPQVSLLQPAQPSLLSPSAQPSLLPGGQASLLSPAQPSLLSPTQPSLLPTAQPNFLSAGQPTLLPGAQQGLRPSAAPAAPSSFLAAGQPQPGFLSQGQPTLLPSAAGSYAQYPGALGGSVGGLGSYGMSAGASLNPSMGSLGSVGAQPSLLPSSPAYGSSQWSAAQSGSSPSVFDVAKPSAAAGQRSGSLSKSTGGTGFDFMKNKDAFNFVADEVGKNRK